MPSSDQFVSSLDSAAIGLAVAASHKHFQFATHEEACLAFQHIAALTVSLHAASHRIVDALTRKRWAVEENGEGVDQSFYDAIAAMESVRLAANFCFRRAGSAAQVADGMQYPKRAKSR